MEAAISALEREPKLSDRVAKQLEALVISHFRAGDRLPSERDLAERFAVSRTVVREAVRSLVTKGLLEVRMGSGTLVRAMTPESATASMSLLLRSSHLDYAKVTEVRRVLEVAIAGLAAERRTPDDLAALTAILDQAAEHLDDPDTFIETDVAFHAGLARATHNTLFSVLLDSIADVLTEVRHIGLRVPGTPARALGYHKRILACIRDGDAEGARQAMHSHMDEAFDTMQAAVENTP